LVKTSDREGGTLQLGDIWAPQACITLCCYLITGTLLHKKCKAAIMLGLLLGSVMFWGYMGTWPKQVFSTLSLAFDYDFSAAAAVLPSAENHFEAVPSSHLPVVLLTVDLFFIVIVLFSGLTTGMSHCAGLTRHDGSTPRSRWVAEGLSDWPLFFMFEYAPATLPQCSFSYICGSMSCCAVQVAVPGVWGQHHAGSFLWQRPHPALWGVHSG
jgi:xanthine/uracil/vitamin C permease (AzgA family)